jgi:hypothetical protein
MSDITRYDLEVTDMKRAWVSYTKIRGEYFIECHIDGEWSGGGTTGCKSFEEAYIFASKVAKSKGDRLERFFSDA